MTLKNKYVCLIRWGVAKLTGRNTTAVENSGIILKKWILQKNTFAKKVFHENVSDSKHETRQNVPR